jgi:hypothetical protein
VLFDPESCTSKEKRALRSAIKKNILSATAVLVSAAATTVPAAGAFIQPKLVIQSLSTKPQFAQYASQDLLLRTDQYGSIYLYVEQEEGTILAILDVTDPDHMKLTTSVPIEGHGAYDFVHPIGGSTELVAFRDGSGTAIIDFRKAKKPQMSVVHSVSDRAIEQLGTAGYLSSSIPQVHTVAIQPRDVQLLETGRRPRVLATLNGVTRQINRFETGTIFLLAKGKVIVIRRLDAERQYTMDQEIDRHLHYPQS